MSVTYPILERDTLQVNEGPFNLAAYDFNKDGYKDFVFSSQVEWYISQNGNLFVCMNENGKFNNSGGTITGSVIINKSNPKLNLTGPENPDCG